MLKSIRILFILLLCLPCVLSTAATDARLGGGFLTPEPYLGYSVEDWRNEFQQMKDIGMRTVIMRHTINSSIMKSYYPTSIPGMTMSATAATDFDNMMDAADAEEMDVHLGLVIDEDTWFKWNWALTETSYPEELVSTSTIVANELFARYGGHSSLKGMYLPQEIDNANYRTEKALGVLTNRVLNPICNHIKSLRSSLIVSDAPFYNSNSAYAQPAEWQSIWTTILNACPNLDLIIVQDGIGANTLNTFEVIERYFAATRAACDATGRQFWSDLEMFTIGAAEYAPPDFSRVKTQLAIEAPYVDHFVCWVWQYCSPTYSPKSFAFNCNYKRYLEGKETLVNESLGKSYSYSLAPSTIYPDPNMTKLTDGKWSIDYVQGGEGDMVGWWDTSNAGTLTITLDLGEVKKGLTDFRLIMIHADGAAVPALKSDSVRVMVSNGVSNVDLGLMTNNESKSTNYAIYRLTTSNEYSARYVVYTFPFYQWAICNEIEVYSSPPQTPVEISGFELE